MSVNSVFHDVWQHWRGINRLVGAIVLVIGQQFADSCSSLWLERWHEHSSACNTLPSVSLATTCEGSKCPSACSLQQSFDDKTEEPQESKAQPSPTSMYECCSTSAVGHVVMLHTPLSLTATTDLVLAQERLCKPPLYTFLFVRILFYTCVAFVSRFEVDRRRRHLGWSRNVKAVGIALLM